MSGKAYPMKARITRGSAGEPVRVNIFDDVGDDGWGGGLSAADFTAQLAGVKGPLSVYINSYGGDVFAGQAMAEAIREYPGPSVTKAVGIAASIASVILQAGKTREIAPGGVVMIHDAWTVAGGNAADLRAQADVLDKISDALAGEFARRAGGTPEQWRDAMRGERWYDAQEALEAGLVDKISDGAARLPASADVEQLAAHAPARIMAALRSMPKAAAPGGTGDDGTGMDSPSAAKCKTCKGSGRLKHPGTGKPGVKCPGCGGSGTYDPDGDGDDDTTPEGDTDHDYVLPDGSPGPKALTEERVREILREEVATAAAAAFRADAKVDTSPWDGGKAMANGAASDDPAKFYAGICAGRKDGDPAVQSSWALPYRYHPGDAPNAAGVKAALGRLPQTQGLTNAAEAKRTLQAAMKQVNPDYEPEDSSKSVFSARLEQMRAAMPALREVDE